MVDIIHRVGVKAPISQVYAALSTIPGLAGWWTRETKGDAKLGGTIEFHFRNDDGSIKGSMGMEVAKLEPNKAVRWRCTMGPPDWIGTDVTFDLVQDGAFTIVLFGHRGWKEASESMAHCSMKWGTFMLSLRDAVETGRGRPAPEDIKIDNWN